MPRLTYVTDDDGQAILTLRAIQLSNIWPAVRDAMLDSQTNNQPRTPKHFYNRLPQNAA